MRTNEHASAVTYTRKQNELQLGHLEHKGGQVEHKRAQLENKAKTSHKSAKRRQRRTNIKILQNETTYSLNGHKDAIRAQSVGLAKQVKTSKRTPSTSTTTLNEGNTLTTHKRANVCNAFNVLH